MGVRDWIFGSREKALSASPEVVQAIHERHVNPNQLIAVGPNPYGGGERINAAIVEVQSGTYGWLYRESPAVRSVVDYQARNVAQLGLRLYERISDNERHQASDHPAAEALRKPNQLTPGQQFVFDVVASFLVYDNAYVLKLRPKPGMPLTLIPLPSNMVGIIGMNHFIAEGYRIWRHDGTYFDVTPEDIIHWRGYDPEDQRKGFSKLETLRRVLAEDVAAGAANLELMRSGLASAGWIERPLDAPGWDEKGRARFEEDWANRAKMGSKKTPVLEEGMKFHDFGVSPKDAQMLDGRRFTREEVALLYGMENFPPSNEEERMAFYADVLPPLTEMMCSYLDLDVLQGEYGEEKFYFEFNLDEKLMGNERLTALTSASGAPIMTRNESRTVINLPPKEGGDELITPLNVTVGGKPSPQVMPIQDPNKPAQDGSARDASMNGRGKAILVKRREVQRQRRDRYHAEFTDLLRKMFTDMERSSKAGEITTKDFQPTKWVKKLAAALLRLMRLTVEREAGIAAARMGLDDFDMGDVKHYLEATAQGKAEEILASLERAVAAAENASEAFATAKDVQAQAAGCELATSMVNFSHTEAAKQTPDSHLRLKRWLVDELDKSAHPEMDHQIARLGEPFSNGKQYPPFEHPNCACMVEIT